jgi:hypothetical protein
MAGIGGCLKDFHTAQTPREDGTPVDRARFIGTRGKARSISE